MWKFIKHEWKHWLSAPMTWIFLLINTLLVFGAVSSDNITIGGGVGSVHKNAPYVVESYYGFMSLLCLLMTTAFVNAAANRDFTSGMYQFVFSSPIKKRDYYFGKFIGAASIAVIPLLGVSLGCLIGPLMPWIDPNRYGPVFLSGHLQGLIAFGIPNTFIVAVLLYALAIIFRSNIVSFIGAMLILVFYVVSAGFTKDLQKEWLANLLDPFGFRPESILSKYMTVDEKNIHAVPLAGAFFVNRLQWLGISCLILWGTYFRFSFSIKSSKARKEKKENNTETDNNLIRTVPAFIPGNNISARLTTLWQLVIFETRSIIKNPTFIIIVVIGMINLIAGLTSFTGGYGTRQYPVTYNIIDAIRGEFYLFLIGIITFYSGVLVWKERDAKINEIQDATPIPSSLLFISKLVAITIALTAVLSCTILIGIITQTVFGYTRFQLGVYIKSLLIMDMMGFFFMVMIALFFHYTINNRYIAYFAFVAFIILNQFFWVALKINSNMVKYGATPNVTYSDMNGFGPFIPSTVWFNLYWFIFSVLLGFVINAFYIRGKETGFGKRLLLSKKLLLQNKVAISVVLILFISCCGFVYYNTQVLNSYNTEKEQENKQADYEKNYKKYQASVQPRFYRYEYHIDLMPYERSMKASVKAWARNISVLPIRELYFTLPQIPDSLQIQISGSALKLNDKHLGFRIYTLEKPLLPDDSLLITVEASRITKGFENEVSFLQLTQNGTFFNNRDFMPVFGYDIDNEINDKNKRVKLKLPIRRRMPVLNESDSVSRANNYICQDADWVDVNTIISTAADQTAVAPGSLIKSWEQGGRKYFNYQLDHASLDFYSFISAKYTVARKKWNGIELEVYYIPEHAYNVPNMLKSMEKSLDYYTLNFGSYAHRQCRIIEFPRYSGFAQSFPGTMPYSESIGFITDLRNVTKNDIDLVYYVVAHEMGHQYWAHQLCGAGMQGSEMMSEGFAQYSALMVMEKEYGRDKMKKFLKYEMDDYLHGRSSEFEAERPLIRTEHQGYIHYQKASVVLYYLKEMIGEKKMNEALRNLLDSFAYKAPPYSTSLAAVRAFRKVTPDSLQYLINDLFETITIFSNRTVEATYKKTGNEYEVKIKTSSEKFRADSLGKETAMTLADYIDIGIFTKPENSTNLGKALVLKRMKITQKENQFTFRTKERPYQAGIDPYNYLIDRIPDDNLKILSEE